MVSVIIEYVCCQRVECGTRNMYSNSRHAFLFIVEMISTVSVIGTIRLWEWDLFSTDSFCKNFALQHVGSRVQTSVIPAYTILPPSPRPNKGAWIQSCHPHIEVYTATMTFDQYVGHRPWLSKDPFTLFASLLTILRPNQRKIDDPSCCHLD